MIFIQQHTMNTQVLTELAAVWEAKSEAPDCENGNPEAQIENAVDRGRRSARAQCAEELRMLIKIISRP